VALAQLHDDNRAWRTAPWHARTMEFNGSIPTRNEATNRPLPLRTISQSIGPNFVDDKRKPAKSSSRRLVAEAMTIDAKFQTAPSGNHVQVLSMPRARLNAGIIVHRGLFLAQKVVNAAPNDPLVPDEGQNLEFPPVN